MSVITLLVTLAAFLGFVAGNALRFGQQKPKPCCMPDQWTGGIYEKIGTNYRGHGALTDVAINMTYDNTNQRMALHEYIHGESLRKGMRVIAEKKKVYVIDDKTKKCVVTKMDAPMFKPCVPSTATYLREITIGSGSKSLKVDVWRSFISSKTMSAHLITTLTKDCIPVDEVITGEQFKVRYMASVSFYDVVKGITDPSVFKIPKSCKNGQEIEMESSPLLNMFKNLLR